MRPNLWEFCYLSPAGPIEIDVTTNAINFSVWDKVTSNACN